MADSKGPKDLSAEQYIVIEDQLLASETGRAFLRMRDRRATVIAMDEFHGAMRSIRGWLQTSVVHNSHDMHLEVLRRELIEMAASIRKAKTEISAMKPAQDGASSKRINLATEELDAIVHATERATSDILNGAERVLELAPRLRKQGMTEEAELLENEATNILVSCGFQDITGQRISKVVATLRYLEERVDAMIRIWGLDGVKPDELPADTVDQRPDAHLMNGPSLRDGIDQSEVDALFGATPMHTVPAETAIAPAAKPNSWPTAPVPSPATADASAQLDQSSIDSLFP